MQSKIKFITGQKVVTILADDKTNTFVRNGKKYNIETSVFNTKLKTITQNWDDKNSKTGLLSGLECTVLIKDGNKTTVKTISDSLPTSYGMFLQLITGGFDD